MLKIEHLTKIRGEKKAVDDLKLTLAPGRDQVWYDLENYALSVFAADMESGN